MKRLIITFACSIYFLLGLAKTKVVAQDIVGNITDQEIYSDQSAPKWIGQSTARIGAGKTDVNSALVIPFQIPSVPVGEQVTAASFTINLESIANTPVGHLDIYGLNFRSTSMIEVDDYDASAVLIKDDAMTINTVIGLVTITEIDLVDYINTQIANGAVTGDYLFLRLSPDFFETGSSYWTVSTSDNVIKPILTIETGVLSTTVLNPIVDISTVEGIAFSFNISASDGEGDPLVFSISGEPSFVSMDDHGDGTASIVISDESIEGTYEVMVSVMDDNGNVDTEIFTLIILEELGNSAPVLKSIGNVITNEGVSKIIIISATDVDGDPLVFSISNEPGFVSFTDNTDGTATLEVSTLGTVGTATDIIIKVSDGEFTDTESINIIINPTSSGLQKLNLDPVTNPRFALTEELVWPSAIGEADVCIWHDDRFASATISIDDNIEGDHAWWLSMQQKYNIDFTWFIIVNSVTDWSLYQELIDAGNEVQAHDLGIEYGHCDLKNASDEIYKEALTLVRDTINGSLTDNRCLTFAYPCGQQRDYLIRDKYIGMRGVTGHLNYANKINYLDVNSRSGQNKVEDIRVLLDGTEDLETWNLYYPRGLGSFFYHNLNDRPGTETFLAALSAKSDSIWIGSFSEIMQYGQERDSHTLTIDENNDTNIKFTLKDEMHDEYFDFPLTVKLRIDNNWEDVSATQNGNPVEAKVVTYLGNNYVLVKAVPDRGQVIVGNGIFLGNKYYCDPVNGSMVNDGSISSPWTTLEDVFEDNKSFDDNDIIYLLNGNHGSARINGYNNTQAVKITAYNNHTPVLKKIQFINSDFWIVDNLRFEGYGSHLKSTGMVNSYTECDNIIVSDCYFTSIEDSVIFDYSNGSTEDMWRDHTSTGVRILGDNTKIQNCTFHNVFFGVTLVGNNFTIINNVINNFYGDGIQINGGDGTTIVGNRITNSYVSDAQHDDAIQFWNSIGDGEIKNVHISSNIITNFTDEIPDEVTQYNLTSKNMQAIINTDGWANNWVVENNLIVNSHTHGITLAGANDCRIQNNTVVKNPLFAAYQSNTSDPVIGAPAATKPEVIPSANTIVRNNIGTKIATWGFPSNFTVEGNYDIDQSMAINYLECFVDYFNHDFHLNENSPAIDIGVNLDLTSSDLEGNARQEGNQVDAGCYEYGSIIDPNIAPVLSSLQDVTLVEKISSSISISATDVNGDALVFTMTGAPSFVTLVDNGDGTAVLDISDQSVMSISNITVIVSDGLLSDEVTFTLTIDMESGVEQVLSTMDFIIYPNPVGTEGFYIEFNGDYSNTISLIELIDITGKIIYSQDIDLYENNRVVVDRSNINSGLYFVRISNNGIRTIRKLIMQ